MRVRAPLLPVLAAAFGLIHGCGDECASLVVDVRSDYTPGLDVHGIRVEVNGDAPTTRSVGGLDDLVSGVRAAERSGLAGETASVRIELLDRTGASIASRRVRVALVCATAITVVIARSCEGVVCPDGGDPSATECLGGVCVPPECATPGCAAGACTGATDCPAPPAACLETRCASGVCLYPEREGACAADEVCVVDRGCVAVVPNADGGVRDAGGPTDAGCTGECAPGMVETLDCGVCGRATRTCEPTCTWGTPSACTDSDERCTQPEAPSCIHDFCWGWRPTAQSALACIDMSMDYSPGGDELGTLSQEIVGRPGATWTKDNQQASCAGAVFIPAESGVIPDTGVASWVFPYGTSDCENGVLGRWVSRMRITDTDATSFMLPTTSEVTFHNATCSADRSTCTAAQTYCSL